MIEMYKILSVKYDTVLTPQVIRDYSSITIDGMILGCRRVELSMIYVSTILQTGQLMFGIVCLTMLSCLIQLTLLNLNLVNSGNTNLLYMILKPTFKKLEDEVDISN